MFPLVLLALDAEKDPTSLKNNTKDNVLRMID